MYQGWQTQDFIIVRTAGVEDAAVRLQSEPILRGLRDSAAARTVLLKPDPLVPLVIERDACLVFHYADDEAINLIRAAVRGEHKLVVVCLACDVYSFSKYVSLCDIVDIYIAPTEFHQRILASQLYKPVYVLPECVDPIALGQSGGGVRIDRSAPAKRLLWFGYSESFMKSMASLLPVIRRHLDRGSLDSFTLIVDRENFERLHGDTPGFDIIDYDNDTFLDETAAFDYAILSHFALDLAVNSYIKSPNKAVTALVAGLIPLCSDTPNYRSVLMAYGLEQFLFSSPLDLDAMLSGLDPGSDAASIRASGAPSKLLSENSEHRVFNRFLEILEDFANKPESGLTDLQPALYTRVEKPRPIHFREHVRDLLPSALRAVRTRMMPRTTP